MTLAKPAEYAVRPVRIEQTKDQLIYAAGIAGFMILFFVFPAAYFGLHWLWAPTALVLLLVIANVLEQRHPHNRLHLLVASPILLIGPIFFLATILTLWAGQRLHGVWLGLLVLGGLHIVVVNALILRHLDTDGIIAWLLRRGFVKEENGQVWFSLPYKLIAQSGVPGWLLRLVIIGRVFWIGVMVFGAVVFGPGVYSSVNVSPRLLNITGTMMLGFAVLGTRLWQIPLTLTIQRKFALGPLPDEVAEKVTRSPLPRAPAER